MASYQKIDIYAGTKDSPWRSYVGSTRSHKNCREALASWLTFKQIPFESPLTSHVFIHKDVRYSAHVAGRKHS